MGLTALAVGVSALTAALWSGWFHWPGNPRTGETGDATIAPFEASVVAEIASRDDLLVFACDTPSGARFATREFASGEAFLKWAGTEPADCVLLDLRMAGLSGIDVQGELVRRRLGWPIVMLTAHGDVATTRAALKGGAVCPSKQLSLFADMLLNWPPAAAGRRAATPRKRSTDRVGANGPARAAG